MEELTIQMLKAIAASGPPTIILAVACWKLWNANQEERARHAAEEKALQDRIIATYEGLTKAMKESHHD